MDTALFEGVKKVLGVGSKVSYLLVCFNLRETVGTFPVLLSSLTV